MMKMRKTQRKMVILLEKKKYCINYLEMNVTRQLNFLNFKYCLVCVKTMAWDSLDNMAETSSVKIKESNIHF